MDSALKGVIAAIATPITEAGAPDIDRALGLARYLLDNGCDGLNVLGTTGEATSFSLDERRSVMSAYAKSGLPMDRLMVGTGATAAADAVALTRHAAETGFAAALVLPPFYYKGVAEDGLIAYLDAIVKATAKRAIPIYLYHFPALSAVPWTIPLIMRARATFGGRIAGLKDSSGDMTYARQAAAIARDFKVFPANEDTLLEARNGVFAGVISATVNINADLCARGFHQGDMAAFDTACAIRNALEGKPRVAVVKTLLSHIHRDPVFERQKPPLTALSSADRAAVIASYDAARSKRVA